MTPQQAAKACMERVAKCLDEFYAVTSPEMTLIEQDFTEIISQVQPCNPFTTALAGTIQQQMDENVRRANEVIDRAFHEGFPQEIVEPQPKPWWKRWLA